MHQSEIRELKKAREKQQRNVTHWRRVFDGAKSTLMRDNAFLREASARAEIEKINKALGRHA